MLISFEYVLVKFDLEVFVFLLFFFNNLKKMILLELFVKNKKIKKVIVKVVK